MELLMEIEAAAADPAPWIEGDNAPLLFALVLLGHCRVPEAHDTLLRLVALPNDDAEALLDDATTEPRPASAPRGGFRNPFTVISCTGRVFSRRRGSGSSA
ncbi:hypothetical protein BA900_07455 [Spiribacter roseus]|nr:hypothetical protein BA900_07455 [Spiribacter roseus]